MNTHEVIKRPLMTEKSVSSQADGNKFFFAVDPRASKYDIRNAIEEMFKVNVTSVRTMNVGGKMKRVGSSVGRQANWKKAIVKLKEGESIQLFESA